MISRREFGLGLGALGAGLIIPGEAKATKTDDLTRFIDKHFPEIELKGYKDSLCPIKVMLSFEDFKRYAFLPHLEWRNHMCFSLPSRHYNNVLLSGEIRPDLAVAEGKAIFYYQFSEAVDSCVRTFAGRTFDGNTVAGSTIVPGDPPGVAFFARLDELEYAGESKSLSHFQEGINEWYRDRFTLSF